VIEAPATAGDALTSVFVMERSATGTIVVTVLVTSVPCCCACPPHSAKSNVQRAWLTSSCVGSAASTRAWSWTVTVVPPAIVPSGTPVTGFAPGCTMPFTLKLSGTYDVPAGSGSKNTTFVPSVVPAELSSNTV
jgi:hypothetical protein